MRYRKLGNGPLEVSELSFGTWLTVAGGVARAQAIRCIDGALDQGITLFDTANQYGAGEAERVLGQALRAHPRDRYLLTRSNSQLPQLARFSLPQLNSVLLSLAADPHTP